MAQIIFSTPEESLANERARTAILDAARAGRRELSLPDRGITELPAEIGECSAMEVLNLRHNRLATLPPEIGRCRALQMLRLDNNPLTVLPPEIGGCVSLQNLSLASHRLERLPAALGSCTALRELNLRGSAKLTEWPAFDRLWPKLRGVVLSDCELREVPASLAGCRELRALQLDGNRLVVLPEELRDLLWLDRLYLHGNEQLGIPPEVLGPSPTEVRAGRPHAAARPILDYYFSRVTGGALPLDEVKLVFVGRGGVGKSSLVARLVRDHFDRDLLETEGVELCDWKIPRCAGGRAVTAHVWDFAGQVITHSAHQFFFSARSVYVLVLTGRENAEREDTEYWLRLIAAYGTDENGEGPPTLVVCNKWEDRSQRARIDGSLVRERYPFVVGVLETDCATGYGIAELSACLAQTVGNMPWVRLGIARRWSAVKAAIARKPEPYLSYGDFRRLCEQKGVTDPAEQDSLAETLHRLGLALNYRKDQRLREATVLKPHWLTENVYCLVRHAEEQGGLIHRTDLPKILGEEPDEAMRRFLVDLMVRFEIAYPVADEDREPTAWLVPQGLPIAQPKSVKGFLQGIDATRLAYTYCTLPAGLVPRFIVRTHPFIEGEQRWALGVVLAFHGARALIRASPEDRQVKVIVTGDVEEERQRLAGLCQAEFRALHAELRGLAVTEAIQVGEDWVPIEVLERDEDAHRQTGVRTDRGTLEVDPSEELNQLTAPAARDESWKPRIFISYAHSDESKLRMLNLRLTILETAGLIDGPWDDGKITAGDDIDATISAEIDRADVVIMLVSTASLASKYIRTLEMKRALERHHAGQATFVGIILERCDWKLSPIEKVAVLPVNGRELNNWTPRANGWHNISDGLQTLFSELRRKRAR